jgi:hypothetical protein
MTLIELMSVVCSSQPEEWNHIVCWGASSGPAYHDHLQFYEAFDGSKHVLHVSSHTNVIAYIPDVSVTVAYGLKWMDDFREPWVTQFPDPKATSSFADVFYNGALVFRTEYVTVDGGRTMLPLPRSRTSLAIPESQAQFVHLLDRFGKRSSFDLDFVRAGMTLSNDSWPSLGA